MHYHYFTLEQRNALVDIIRGLPETQRNSALDRLRSPDYGVCEACGGDIPFVRLVANPLVKRCPGCPV
jgi:RNA polymerase-binding transcription factor DksA